MIEEGMEERVERMQRFMDTTREYFKDTLEEAKNIDGRSVVCGPVIEDTESGH